MRRLKEDSSLTRFLERLTLPVEKLSKEAIFDCRMCGQCVLHSTGLTCPMRCPKNLRNGPCGGVRPDGHCEVFPDKPCVWVQAIERAPHVPIWHDHVHHVMPPVDWRLRGTSSWINLLTGRDQVRPVGWAELEDEHGYG